jgi:hypothetical protein
VASGSSFVILRSLQIARHKLKFYRGCFKLYRTKCSIPQYQLSCLINNAVEQSIDHPVTTHNSSTMLGRSMYFWKPGHSQLYWAVRRWKILITRTLSKDWSGFKLCITWYYLDMKTEKQTPSQGRLGSVIFLLRMTGIPFKMKTISTIYAIYMITVFISASTLYLGMFVEVYIHREDLGLAMKAIHVLFAYTSIVWTFLYCG